MIWAGRDSREENPGHPKGQSQEELPERKFGMEESLPGLGFHVPAREQQPGALNQRFPSPASMGAASRQTEREWREPGALAPSQTCHFSPNETGS